MDFDLSRRELLVRMGAVASFAWASPWLNAAGPAAISGLIVAPYLQPGSQAGEGPDFKTLIWLTDSIGGDFTVEYGWEGSTPATAAIRRVLIHLDAPTPEQLKKKPAPAKDDPEADHPHEHEVRASPIGEREQNYLKFIADLPNLPRDTTVWYRVRNGGALIGEQTFRTRASAEKPTRFVAVGDLANGKAGQNAIVYQASLAKPNFVLALGDIVYSAGRVSQYMDHFWGTYVNVKKPGPADGAPLMASVPFYAVLGNHDVDTSLNVFPDCLGIYYFFHAPTNGPGEGKWITPISKNKKDAASFRAAAGASYPSLCVYSFDEGPAHFVVLDSNGYAKTDSPELLQWIEKDLKASKARWKFVCMHAPMFHSSPAHYTEQKMRRLSPLLQACGVDVVLSGHVHNYQRSRPIKFEPSPPVPGDRLVHGTFTIDSHFDGVTNTRPDGIIHIVSGGGGGPLYKDPVEKTQELMQKKYGANWAPYTARHVVDRHSFVVCDMTPMELTLRAIDHEGKEIDRMLIAKP